MFSSEAWLANPSSGFYNGVATQSLRFDDGSSAYLTRTPSSASNRRTFTFSAWIKRGVLDADNVGGSNDTPIFSASSANGQPVDVLRTMSQLTAGANILMLYANPSGSLDYSEETNASIRDTSAWYHIVMAVDSTQGTAGNRVKFYINGTLQTAVGQNYGQVPQNHDFHFNNTVAQEIGRNAGNTGRYFDGYMAEVNFVDGYQYDASYFGETKNGIWIAQKYTGSYGTNGYRLEFKNTSVGSGSSSTIGADTSGNDNHFTSSGIVASDCNMPDSPENNFCTLNPLHGASSSYDNQFQLKEGNLHLYNASASNQGTCGTFLMESGKWYWEIYIADTNSTYNHHIGVVNGASYVEPSSGPRAIFRNDGIVYYENTSGNSAEDSSPSAMVAGEVWAVALDADNNTIKFYKSGSQTGNTISLSDPGSAGWKTVTITGQASVDNSYWNYGQDSSFAGQKTSGSAGASDDNGFGDFYYTPPSGHLALCTANLPEPTIGPNADTQADDYFNTVLYTGNGSPATHTLGFRPNWVWGKKRGTNAQNHWLINDVGDIDKFMSSDNDSGESTTAGTTFNATSFTTANNDLYINNNSPYVVWAWKGNGTGTAVSNSNGSITSTVSANTTAGFSIITYSGNATKGATIGHGLSSAPEMIWFKRRDGSAGWAVYNKDLTDNGYALLLNSNASQDNRNTQFLNETSPSSTLITLGDWNEANGGSSTYVAYAFHSVDGYSKIGKYTGNGSTDGVFINLGFRPAWVILKNIVRSADWRINDATRQDVNDEGGHLLLANSNSAEITNEYDIDFLSNGFKLRGGDVYENGSNEAFIYMAFAEAPFKYANAR